MDYLIDPLFEIKEYNKILEYIKKKLGPISLLGPSDSQKAHLTYAICKHLDSKGILITFNEIQAKSIYEDLTLFLKDQILLFPTKEIIYYDIEARSNDEIFNRLTVLDKILQKEYKLIVTSIEAISHKILSKELFQKNTLFLKCGFQKNLEILTEKLINMGYERRDIVEGKGQFAIRGGILDIYSIDKENPLRIEMFDDEIDSIRHFDVLSQRSINKQEEIRILPTKEIIYPINIQRNEIIEKIREDLKEYIKSLKNKKDQSFIEQIKKGIDKDIERFEESPYFPGIDRYIPYILKESNNILDYLEDDVIVFLDEAPRIQQRVGNIHLEYHEKCKNLLESGKILPGSIGAYYDCEDIFKKLENQRNIYMNTFMSEELREIGGDKKIKSFNILSRQIMSYQGFMDAFINDIKQWKLENNRIVILAGTKTRGEKLCEELISNNVEAVFTIESPTELLPGKVIITIGSLIKGFEYPSIKLIVISDKGILSVDRKTRKRSKGKIKGTKISLFTDLNLGDYVVHQTHGIGQYEGINSLVVDNVKRDYLKIRYQEKDFLYIPTSNLDAIQKYIGSEGKAPRLNKLSGTDWIKTKKKVKESLRKLAEELIRLYAQRKAIEGFAFSKDTIWQKQFEDLFPFEETEDQLKSVEEIKIDMESNKPMDRLLCGDVGYGKTEVALRAAFKAVMDGKQATFLVPTTVLAQQHYDNFKERFKDFPVSVEMINRFRTKAEQKRILKDLKKGYIDVLIGTHRLLQQDVKFKDLGLIIIDEEQRFGVIHKEKLKNIRPDVDVLTLTATPIPRTLHMSLAGVRDMSVIEDPPENRYPVQTYVMEYNEEIIKDSIIRELNRGGQVFYLYNRVKAIDFKGSQIQKLVPHAAVGIAHGQMEGRNLEDIMLAFMDKEFDVLVCTTIIESGLDMPNVNTIIIEDADRMGLAQLYQLRGRVGRSDRLAYAYITYKRDKVLTEIAEKRLQAIKEFTEFGSGFKIAMRDLEIRGAGNLLGSEQHGHIESVGYDMYCRLLGESVLELKGNLPLLEDVEVLIDIKVDAYIDNKYISNELQKIEIYKKIASIEDDEDLLDIQDELLDRYGDMPDPVKNLIQVSYIKALARKLNIVSVSEKDNSVIFKIRDGKNIILDVIKKLIAKYKNQILFNAGTSPYILYRNAARDRNKLLENIKIILHDIKSFEVK